MRKTILFSFLTGAALICNGQTNTFPLDGNVGIGTLSPNNDQGWNKVLELKGDIHAKLLVTTVNGVKLGMFSHDAFNAKIGTESNHNLTFTAGYWNDIMTLTTQGKVGIGTLTPSEKFSVKGKILAEEVKVQSSTSWPDYVFAQNYKKIPLPELEQFIAKNKHLPDIPSAQQVAKDGIELGTNQAALLKKIEELTLYIIDQNNELKKQNEKITRLEKKITQLNSKGCD